VSESLIVTIPGAPPAALSPNGRTFWATKAKAVKQARSDAYYAARNANAEMWEPTPPLVIHAVIAWPRKGTRRDDDNAKASLKAYIDGIADAIGIDDKHFTLATVTQDHDPEKRGYVRVAIEQGQP
jgi:crossover junction endodeoxyribonuclease RusA